jgi:multidrug/hemolysin transport system ATP-binding protein
MAVIMEKIIEISNLVKHYGEVKAVDGIDFYVDAGTLFAFLGPNGAGKSTTIDIICTLLKPDSGTVIINGKTISKDDNEIRKEIGIVFQDSVLDNLLTVRENLIARGSFYGLKGEALKNAVTKAAEAVGVTEFIDRPYGKLSGGQRRRSDIARALVNTPKILFLDEPTTGLDPKTRKNVWSTITKLQKDTGMTVFLTTHYMEEAANADYVAVIDQGKIIAKGTPSELREKYSNDRIIITPIDLAKAEEKLKEKNIQTDDYKYRYQGEKYRCLIFKKYFYISDCKLCHINPP